MGGSSNEALIGRIAVQCKMITLDQLAAATREQGRRGGRTNLGDILVEQRVLAPRQLARLVQMQRAVLARRAADQAAARAAPTLEAPAPAAAPPAAPPAASPAPEPPATPAAQPAVRPAPQAAPAPSAAPGQAAGRAEQALHEQLRRAVQAGASDVHLHSGAQVQWRRHGVLEAQAGGPLAADAAEAMVTSILTPEQRQVFEEHGEIDLAYSLAGVGRFRVNVYRQQRGVDGAFRAIPAAPPALDELSLPSSLAKLTNFHQGMVLVTGPSGCGKTSTMAALLNLVNEERCEHILTVEDPIEVLHPSKRCLVNQRQVRAHTESFARALRAALREDPDVIAIGELRDLETISLALTAAETGHFVMATLHTSSTIRTIDRLIGAFPPDQQAQVRTMLSESLRAVVSQRLVPRADGEGRVPALEVLIVNKAVGNLVRDAKTFQIRSILQTGASQGMCLLDESLAALVRDGSVTREAALRQCEDPKRFGGA